MVREDAEMVEGGEGPVEEQVIRRQELLSANLR